MMTSKFNSILPFLKYLIVEKRLRQEPAPSLEQLKECLESELKEIGNCRTSRLSVKGDLSRLKKLFNINIKYSFRNNNYSIAKQQTLLNLSPDALDTLRFNFKLNCIFGSKLEAIQGMIDMERARAYTREDYLITIAKAMSEQKEIRIRQKSASSKRSWAYELAPYLLRVIDGKAFLYGESKGELRTYQLEELTEAPELLNKKVTIPTLQEIEKLVNRIDKKS